jgi:NAD(P)-dependent dehydrogenase (short-subunit alcohol dehydrogenase family)
MASTSEKKQTKISDEAKKQFQKELDAPVILDSYKGSGKLQGRVAFITGGDSGIGRSVAVHFAREGADIAILYHKSDNDARETKKLVEKEGRRCEVFQGDASDESLCKSVLDQVKKSFGKLDILVNNAGTHDQRDDIRDIDAATMKRTFEVNMYPFFYFTKAAVDYMSKDGSIINTTSIVAYEGSDHLIDYAATKGAIVSFTRSLAKGLVETGIRVNAVAPGPIWTPLVVYSKDQSNLENFGKRTPMKRAGYPHELAPSYVYLASNVDSSYVTGQVLHVNGGGLMDS